MIYVKYFMLILQHRLSQADILAEGIKKNDTCAATGAASVNFTTIL